MWNHAMHTKAASQVNRFGLSRSRGLGDGHRYAMPVICEAIRCQLALRIRTKPTPAEHVAVDHSLCLAMVMSERRCGAKSVLPMGSSPLQALFGGDAVEGYTAANNPSPVGIQRPKPG